MQFETCHAPGFAENHSSNSFFLMLVIMLNKSNYAEIIASIMDAALQKEVIGPFSYC